MRYDYYAGEGFGIHARLGTVNIAMAHSNEYKYDIADADDEDILVEDLDDNQMGALNMIYINVEMIIGRGKINSND